MYQGGVANGDWLFSNARRQYRIGVCIYVWVFIFRTKKMKIIKKNIWIPETFLEQIKYWNRPDLRTMFALFYFYFYLHCLTGHQVALCLFYFPVIYLKYRNNNNNVEILFGSLPWVLVFAWSGDVWIYFVRIIMRKFAWIFSLPDRCPPVPNNIPSFFFVRFQYFPNIFFSHSNYLLTFRWLGPFISPLVIFWAAVAVVAICYLQFFFLLSIFIYTPNAHTLTGTG